MRRLASSRLRLVLLATAAIAVLFAVVGCKDINEPMTEKRGAVEATGTVQADLSAESSGASAPSSGGGPSESASQVAPTTQSPNGTWPERVDIFAKDFNGPVWYPTYVPAGFKLDSADVVELDTGSGLVLDVVYVSGEKALQFTQGSPTTRDYEIVSKGKAAWGADKADIMNPDPEDPSTPPYLVIKKDGNLAELSGDLPLAELKKIAASMTRVK